MKNSFKSAMLASVAPAAAPVAPSTQVASPGTPAPAPALKLSDAARRRFLSEPTSAASTAAPARDTYFKLTTTPSQSPAPNGTPSLLATSIGKIHREDVAKSVLVLLPIETEAKLRATLGGSLAPGVVGLIEFALQELQRQGAHLTISN